MTIPDVRRRSILKTMAAVLAGAGLAGCDRLSRSGWFTSMLESVEPWNQRLQRGIALRSAMAQEFPESALSPRFRSNGTAYPDDPGYRRLARSGFTDWRLEVGGLVKNPLELGLDELRALPSRTQITRHDCVEGWSAIGKWTGVPLRELLARAHPEPSARYVLFHCADAMDVDGNRYYESIDMVDAVHPQTILAYELNDRPLPIANGAPVRVRVERQLGYKMAKYIMSIELAAGLSHVGQGKGGYWEDRGYAWYAGI